MHISGYTFREGDIRASKNRGYRGYREAEKQRVTRGKGQGARSKRVDIRWSRNTEYSPRDRPTEQP